MIEQFKDIVAGIQSNQLLLALMGGGIFYQLISNIRSIFGTIYHAIISCISFTINSVSVADYDVPILNYKISKVLSDSKVLWERHSELRPSSSNYSEKRLVNSAYGRSYRWIWGHFMILDRTYSTQSTKVVTTITARIFFANRKKFIDRLMRAIENCSLTENRDSIIVNMGRGIITEKPKRDINSIYSNSDIPNKILEDIKAFLENKQTYIESNSPYKFVALLSGTPGSGKTSAIHAIASELSMGVRFINTEDDDFEDIARIMTRSDDCDNSIKRRDIIVIEDVDCIAMGASEKRNLNTPPKNTTNPFDESPKNSTNLSLTSILNLLDGIVTPSGTIVFLTSNKPENLDPALLRDGRIDAKYSFGNFNGETANRLVQDFLGFKIDNIKEDITPSSIQRDALKVRINRMSREEFEKKYSKC